MYCDICGFFNEDSNRFCTNCGRVFSVGYPFDDLMIDEKLHKAIELKENKSYDEALDLFCQLASLNSSDALFQLGTMYGGGLGVEKDVQKAFEYYKRAYEHGWYTAFNKYGWCLTNNFGTENDYDLAYKVFMEGDEKGIDDCTANVGWCYQNGRGVAKNMDKAKEYYKKAADMGNDWAKEQLNKYF